MVKKSLTQRLTLTSISPRWVGDNIYNPSVYNPKPDLENDYQIMQGMNAALYAQGQGRASSFYTRRGMMPFTASSGPALIEQIILNPAQVLAHSLRLSPGDEPFLTMQGVGKVLPQGVMRGVLSKNYNYNRTSGDIARQHIRGDGVYIGRVDMREGYARGLARSHSALGNTTYEDSAFEIFFWHDLIAFDQDFFVYGGPHAWSNNATLEKSMQAGIQYAYASIMAQRGGRSSDALDIFGNPISIPDLAWETARGVVDLLTTEVQHEGEPYRFRFDTGALEYLTRSCYNHMDLNGLGERFGAPHASVVAHRNSPQSRDLFAELDSLILPFLAENCSTKTFERLLENDTALEAYWKEHVFTRRPELRPEREIISKVLGREPAGAYISNTLRKKASDNSEPGSKPVFFSQPLKHGFLGSSVGSPGGQHEDLFDAAFAPEIFAADLFTKLGTTARPGHLTARQEAAKHAVASLRPTGAADPDLPYTLLLWDKPNTLPLADDYRKKNDIRDIRATKGAVNPLEKPRDAFEHAVANPAQDQTVHAIEKLRDNKGWRASNRVGNIIPHSIVDQNCNFTGRDPQTGWERSRAFNATDSLEDKESIRSAVLYQMAANEWQGLILTGPSIDEELALVMSAALMSICGKVKRLNSGTDYVARIFELNLGADGLLEDATPKECDLADLILKVGSQAAPLLQKDVPDNRRYLYGLLAQLLYVFDCAMDSSGINQASIRNQYNAAHSKESTFDFDKISEDFLRPVSLTNAMPEFFAANDNAYVPAGAELKNLMDDPHVRMFLDGSLDMDSATADPHDKARLVQMIRFPLRKLLLDRGIGSFEAQDIKDLKADPEYAAAYQIWHNKTAKQQAEWLHQTNPSATVFVSDPEVSK